MAGTDTALEPSATTPAAVSQPDSSKVQIGRELLTAVISLAILIVSMTAFGLTFSAGREAFADAAADAGKKAAYERQKDLLGIAIGLLGTVTGYYLGRVPAELRAQTAQGLLQDATTATTQANQNAENVKRDARAQADAALAALQGQPAARTAEQRSREPVARSETELDRPNVEKARALLEEMIRRL